VKLKTKMLGLILIFSSVLVIAGVITVFTVQDKVIATAHEKLRSDIALARALVEEKYPGEWSIREDKLFKADILMNGNVAVVDMIGNLTGDTVTIFQGDTRIATNVKTPSGERAVGTKAADNVIQATLSKGQNYIGKANVVGIVNQTAYEPIKNSRGDIIGMFYVGVPNTYYENVIRNIAITIIIVGVIGIALCFGLGYFTVNSVSKNLERAIDRLTNSSDQIASATVEVSASSQSLAEGASEQAASIEETSSSLEEMSSMTKQNADNSDCADKLMKESRQMVDRANGSMTHLTQSMQEISAASEETSKIIKTIDEIAFQTNLLALNAAVEAARAGEAGAGFAVVANEVRNLAMRAAEAARNTSTLIEGTVKKVNEGTELVERTNSAFSEVSKSAAKVADLVSEIAAASGEQAQGIDQINKAITEMNRVTQQTAANAEQSASASEEMNAQAEQMKEIAQELIAIVFGSSSSEKGSKATT
jgi:methyl-accepting chemotaxis protein